MGEERELHLVVYGASGFVGQLTAQYLARAAPPDTRIGLAGRSRQRLEAVRASLAPAAADWPILIADSSDEMALAEMVSRTRAVATTVGPYGRYGMPLVTACAEAGTHYADLTGEVLFIRRTIETLQDAATVSGARIVHSCGFDSVPSDLGVLLLHLEAKGSGSGRLGETTAVYGPLKGGVSGGTIASMKDQVDEAKRDAKNRRIIFDPYALSPDRARDPDGRDERDPMRPRYEPDFDTWTAPFIMALFNTRVVRRSNALNDYAYGNGLRYREVMATGKGPVGAVGAAGVTAGLGALFAAFGLKPTRMLLDRFLPEPGEGPSEKTQREGHFRLRLRAETEEGRTVTATVGADNDPGYAATAVMLAESGLALALDGPELPDAAGILTPASGIGLPLIERLRRAGQTYESAVS